MKLTQEKLKEVLDFNEKTGVFTWKIKRGRVKTGDIAGSEHKGRRVIRVFNQLYRDSSLAWLYCKGELPVKRLRYINGDSSDIRIENLEYSGEVKLTQEKLKKIIHYDPNTGVFKWIVKRASKVTPGQIIKPNVRGRVIMAIDGKKYPAPHIAWLYMEGYFPEYEIDHINRDSTDNRWCNLRHVTHRCNLRNVAVKSNNTSGVVGVYYHKEGKKWTSQIHTAEGGKHLGMFTTFDDAVMARWQAEKAHGFSNCQTTSSAYLYLKNKGLI